MNDDAGKSTPSGVPEQLLAAEPEAESAESAALEPGPDLPLEAAPSGLEPVQPGATPSADEASAPPAVPPLSDAEREAQELELLKHRPTYVFFGVVSAVSLFLDVASKSWAEIELSKRTLTEPVELVKDHLSLYLAYNKGGAWGLLQDQSEAIRKPFFLAVSVLAIAFIISLYSRLAPNQRALKWGLPLVLGGALGNLSDRIIRSSVIDFIDYRADWVQSMNAFVARFAQGWSITDHWPTFNVADISICIGVGLMAVDMITSRRRSVEPAPATAAAEPAPPPESTVAAPLPNSTASEPPPG